MQDPYLGLISLTLPDGLPDFFELISVKKEEGVLCLYLEEKNIIPMEHRGSGIHSKGFHAAIQVTDFPIRGKKVLLCIKNLFYAIGSYHIAIHYEELSTGYSWLSR